MKSFHMITRKRGKKDSEKTIFPRGVMKMFDLNKFISDHVTKRPGSMFLEDLQQNKEELQSRIKDRTVLVIGGAGSIGSSFIKAVLPYGPRTLVAADVNENALTELTRELRSSRSIRLPKDYITYPMDYASRVFSKMFQARGGFDIVANFSAHKHVRSEKDVYSIEALLYNNVINAKKLLDLLSEFPPETYFCVSTDKAANPVNIMGASKRIMEDLIFSYSEKFPVKTARFANVAFSNGSLPEGFLKRLEKQQPLSAPSDVKRYFVSPEESGQICLLSCILGGNREIFFPKLEKESMMSFDRIAEELLKQKGFEPLHCISEEDALCRMGSRPADSVQYPVYFSRSDTSGEKPFEEFYTGEETVNLDRFFSLGVVEGKTAGNIDEIEAWIQELEELFLGGGTEKEEIVTLIKKYLPDFEHMETGKNLDAKM